MVGSFELGVAVELRKRTIADRFLHAGGEVDGEMPGLVSRGGVEQGEGVARDAAALILEAGGETGAAWGAEGPRGDGLGKLDAAGG